LKLRLHEIELAAADVKGSTAFFQTVLGLQPSIQQQELSVFDAGIKGLDVNISSHQPPGIATISFLTDDLDEAVERLRSAGISYQGPMASHLGMTCIQFKSPDGYVIKVASPGPESPHWLTV
jgi:predicted enzyme related to lactoylglutathione lyase